jgi:hypothetical protein
MHQAVAAPLVAAPIEIAGHDPNDPAWLLGEIEWWKREHERLRYALIRVRSLCANRERFVMMGPRGFQAAVVICDEALIEPDPHIFPKALVRGPNGK